MIFVAVTVISTIAIWLTFPEVGLALKQMREHILTETQTQGLPLEEINAKFGDHVEIDLKSAVVVGEAEQGRMAEDMTYSRGV